jgi:hypothetical protein
MGASASSSTVRSLNGSSAAHTASTVTARPCKRIMNTERRLQAARAEGHLELGLVVRQQALQDLYRLHLEAGRPRRGAYLGRAVLRDAMRFHSAMWCCFLRRTSSSRANASRALHAAMAISGSGDWRRRRRVWCTLMVMDSGRLMTGGLASPLSSAIGVEGGEAQRRMWGRLLFWGEGGG